MAPGRRRIPPFSRECRAICPDKILAVKPQDEPTAAFQVFELVVMSSRWGLAGLEIRQ
jgi:hypothetical protein